MSSGAGRSPSTRRSARRSPSSPRPPSPWRPCSTCPRRWPTRTATTSASRRALAKLYGTEMAWLIADELVQIRGGRGYETRRLAGRPRRTRRPRRADAARPADQPDLRGLHRDHAPADRPRGRRRAPVGRRRPHRPGQAALATRRKAGAQRRRLLRPLAAEAGRGPGPAPARVRRVPPRHRLAAHLRYVERAARKLARSTFYAMSRWQGRMETKQGFLGRIVDIGAELFAMSAACVRAELLRTTRRARPRGRTSWPTSSAGSPASASRSSSAGCGATPTTSTARWSTGVLSRHVHLAGGGRRRPVGRRPLDRRRDPRPVQQGERPPPRSADAVRCPLRTHPGAGSVHGPDDRRRARGHGEYRVTVTRSAGSIDARPSTAAAAKAHLWTPDASATDAGRRGVPSRYASSVALLLAHRGQARRLRRPLRRVAAGTAPPPSRVLPTPGLRRATVPSSTHARCRRARGPHRTPSSRPPLHRAPRTSALHRHPSSPSARAAQRGLRRRSRRLPASRQPRSGGCYRRDPGRRGPPPGRLSREMRGSALTVPGVGTRTAAAGRHAAARHRSGTTRSGGSAEAAAPSRTAHVPQGRARQGPAFADRGRGLPLTILDLQGKPKLDEYLPSSAPARPRSPSAREMHRHQGHRRCRTRS